MQIAIGMTLTAGLGGLVYTYVLLLDDQGQAIEDDETPETYWAITSLEDEANA